MKVLDGRSGAKVHPHSGADAVSEPPLRGGELDKLEKCRQAGHAKRAASREALSRRARSKWLTWALTERLTALESPSQEYGRAFGCSKGVEQEEGRLTSYYCRCRWCVTCNRIRMGHRINTYGPILREWGGAYLVTLTVPNVRAGELRDELGEMLHQFNLCKLQIRRTRGLQFACLRALEVTFNAERSDFHPHYHIAVKGEQQAYALVAEWLKRWPDAVRAAQDVTEWDGEDGGLKELTKYCTKLVAGEPGEEPPPAWALDVIFDALDGKHLFEPIGFSLPDDEADFEDADEEAFDELEARVVPWKRIGEKVMWWWVGSDWVDRETGECLTGYAPSEADEAAVGRSPP